MNTTTTQLIGEDAQVIYIWRSEALKQVGMGWLVTQAVDVQHARKNIRRYADEWLRSDAGREYWFHVGGVLDSFFRDDYEKFWGLLEADLAKDPTIDTTLMIWGST